MKSLFLLFICLSFLAGSVNAEQKFTLEKALDGWKDLKYDVTSGLKSKKGDLTTPGYLGCSGFASIIYHRMKYGEDWLKNFDFTVQMVYGDEGAKKLGFSSVGSKTGEDWKNNPPSDGLYWFYVRKGVDGHVGFIDVKAGKLNQHHYSSMKKYNGYASGEFSDWYPASQYKAEKVELFKVTF